jgi:hypothetical protein
MSDDIKKLELRITELENMLKGVSAKANIDPKDLETYHKVSKQLGGGECVNECQVLHSCVQCFHCITCFQCLRCINECICGPCNTCIVSTAGGARFGSLG